MSRTSAPTSQIRLPSGQDHESINSELAQLALIVEHSTFRTIERRFNDVGRHLRAHLAAEERIFPAFERDFPWEIKMLREEHEGFRRTLDQLLVLAEVYLLDKESVHRFIAELREHAAQEDETIYRWAEGLPTDEPCLIGLTAYLRSRLKRSLAAA